MRFTTLTALLCATVLASVAVSPANAKNSSYDKQANILAMQMYAQQLANNGQLPAPAPWVYTPAPNPYARAYSNDPNQAYYYHNGYTPAYPVYQPYPNQYPVYQANPQQAPSKWGKLLNLIAPQN